MRTANVPTLFVIDLSWKINLDLPPESGLLRPPLLLVIQKDQQLGPILARRIEIEGDGACILNTHDGAGNLKTADFSFNRRTDGECPRGALGGRILPAVNEDTSGRHIDDLAHDTRHHRIDGGKAVAAVRSLELAHGC